MNHPQTILTGDRPTGQLHLGHYVGSLRQRVALQHNHQQFILIADLQGLTDNGSNPQKISHHILEVMADYLAVGIDPRLTTICLQSALPALAELLRADGFPIRGILLRNDVALREKEGLPQGKGWYPLPGEAAHHKQNMFALLKRPGVLAGMTAIFMAFAGQFAFFTYIRPVYMNLAGFGVDGLTLVLLSFGIASFIGTSLSSFILKRSVKLALAGAPLILAVSALVLTLWGSDKIVATGVAIIWGLTFALVPVGWSTWITRSLADQAEKAGSIQVAVIQLANTCGAAIGGYALDNIGLTSPLMLSGTLMLLTALLVTAKVKMKKS